MSDWAMQLKYSAQIFRHKCGYIDQLTALQLMSHSKSTAFFSCLTDYLWYIACRHRIQSVHIQRMQRVWNLDTEAT